MRTLTEIDDDLTYYRATLRQAAAVQEYGTAVGNSKRMANLKEIREVIRDLESERAAVVASSSGAVIWNHGVVRRG